MTRSRYATLTAGAGVTAATIAIIFFKAPVIPAAIGVMAAVVILLMRKPQE